MLVLTEATDSIQVVLEGSVTTNQLQCFSSFRQITAATYTPGRNALDTSDTTDVDLVPAPTEGQRVVDFLSVFNADTANATVIIKLDANGTETILFKATLSTGEKIEYQEASGFRVITNSGAVKNSINQGNNPATSTISSVVLGSDVINNNATLNTLQDVTGLSFPVTTGTYWFRFVIWFTAAATTTGSRWTIQGTTNSLLGYRTSHGLSAVGTAGTDVMTEVNQAAFDTPAASNTTSSTATAGQANMVIIEGLINSTADGSVIARFASEIANSAITAKAGSTVFYQKMI